MVYETHGKFTIWTQGNVVLAELIGCWNEESALQFEIEFKKIASAMPARWGHIVYLNDWELCVPEMVAIIERLVAWCIENGLICAANVYKNSSLKNKVLNSMIVDKQGDFQRAVFNNELDAITWLNNEGFPIAATQR